MIKVDVVSGFLGAGKTTLVRKLLKVYEKEKVVLIENEFGEIGIDGELVERDGFEVFEISNGCICCIMQKDFVHMLSRIIEEFKPQRIIIEPTGISILSEIIEILKRPEFASRAFWKITWPEILLIYFTPHISRVVKMNSVPSVWKPQVYISLKSWRTSSAS